jgi:hypothetical protein
MTDQAQKDSGEYETPRWWYEPQYSGGLVLRIAIYSKDREVIEEWEDGRWVPSNVGSTWFDPPVKPELLDFLGIPEKDRVDNPPPWANQD